MPGLPGELRPSTFAASRPAPTPTVELTLLPTEKASVDLDECISRLYKKQLLAESVVEAICAKTKELLMRESNVVHVRAPVTVVGDIHGQFFDLIEIFRIGGYCPDTNYLFLGTISLPLRHIVPFGRRRFLPCPPRFRLGPAAEQY